MKNRISVLLVLLVLLFVGRGNAQQPKKSSFTTTVKFEPMAQHGGPIISVRLNDEAQVRFLLDTGTSMAAVRRDVAEKMKLPLEDIQGQFKVVNLKSIQFGEWKRYGPVMVLEGPLSDYLRDNNIDGIMGQNYLEGCALLLNFDKQEFTLVYPGNLSKEDVAHFGYADNEATPISITFKEQKLFYFADTRIEGNTAPLLVDSGSRVTIFPKPFAKTMRSKPVYERELLVRDGIRKEPLYLVPGVTVGETTGGAQAVIVSKDDGEYSSILGVDFLAQFNVLMDLPAKRLYLHRLNKVNPSLLSNRQTVVDGMTIGVEEKVWRIVSIDSASRFFRAGLRQGDVIEAVDATTVKELLTDQVKAALEKPDVQSVRVARTVDTKVQNITVVLPKQD